MVCRAEFCALVTVAIILCKCCGVRGELVPTFTPAVCNYRPLYDVHKCNCPISAGTRDKLVRALRDECLRKAGNVSLIQLSNGIIYHQSDLKLNYNEASIYCRSLGMEMVKINSLFEAQSLASHFVKFPIMIGLQKSTTFSDYFWSDGSKFCFDPKSIISGSEGDCVVLSQGNLVSHPCLEVAEVVCKLTFPCSMFVCLNGERAVTQKYSLREK